MNPNPLIIIGGGNMGGAIARRWEEHSVWDIHLVEPDRARRSELAACGIAVHEHLEDAPLGGVYLLAIKPQQFAENTASLIHTIGDRESLVISIMAGVALADLQKISPNAVRVMPNLPAMVGESMSVLCAPQLDASTRQEVTHLFSHIGAVAWVEDEEQLHAVTAISGSGPGYVFAFMEALQHAANHCGLAPELARQLVTQTLRGSAALAAQSVEDFATLREQVTSKGGTTEAALKSFSHDGFNRAVTHAVEAAARRSRELSKK